MIGSVTLDAMMCRAVQIVPFVTWKGYQTQHMQAPEIVWREMYRSSEVSP